MTASSADYRKINEYTAAFGVNTDMLQFKQKSNRFFDDVFSANRKSLDWDTMYGHSDAFPQLILIFPLQMQRRIPRATGGERCCRKGCVRLYRHHLQKVAENLGAGTGTGRSRVFSAAGVKTLLEPDESD